MITAPLIDLTDVSVRRGTALVLHGVSIRIESGTVVSLEGANGSGKSTLLRVLATLLSPHAGEGSILGAKLGTTEVRSIRSRIGLVGHETALRRGLTLRENLELVTRLRSDPNGAEPALARVGMFGAADRLVEHCSNGMLRRADLARLFVTRPLIALLDEPRVGLDQAAGHLVDDLIAQVTAGGGAVVVTSHGADHSTGLNTRHLTLDNGSIIEGRP